MSRTVPVPAEHATDRPQTWEMVVVHRVFRREFGALPALVRAVPAGDVARAAVVLAHLRELARSLHHHHTAEDELVWPLLLDRVDLDRPLVLRMEEQHERVADLLERADVQAGAFAAAASPVAGETLAATLTQLATALEEHLGDEEREVLPLVERHLTVAEWDAVGERARASLPKDRLLIQLGAILEGCSPQEARRFLGMLPLPARLAWRLAGRRAYRAERARVYGP
jgi:hemerythrin-like domain-containing protein